MARLSTTPGPDAWKGLQSVVSHLPGRFAIWLLAILGGPLIIWLTGALVIWPAGARPLLVIGPEDLVIVGFVAVLIAGYEYFLFTTEQDGSKLGMAWKMMVLAIPILGGAIVGIWNVLGVDGSLSNWSFSMIYFSGAVFVSSIFWSRKVGNSPQYQDAVEARRKRRESVKTDAIADELETMQ